jgi:hypothetical protein
MTTVFLLGLGTIIFVGGLLQSTYPPFQRWLYRYTDKKLPDIYSDEYKASVANMRIVGSRAALAGGLLMIFALAQLGLLH